MTGSARAEITDELRRILADVTGNPEVLDIALQTPLFGSGAGLDSLAGTLLLRRVWHQFGVDVAGEDLNLDSLATLETLAAFVHERAPGHDPLGGQAPG